jgi:drug/metabolite transporter (DMT)-like permease
MKAVAVILALALLSLGGDWLLKLASQREQPYTTTVFVLGALAYGATAIGWVIVMQHMTLATIGVWYSIVMILLLTALGVFAFEETLSAREGLGLVLACVALMLMSRFA